MATIGRIPDLVIDMKTGRMTPEAKRWFYEVFSRVGGAENTIAPSDSYYIIKQTNTSLPNAIVLSNLNAGFLKLSDNNGTLSSTGYSTIQASDLSETTVTVGDYTINNYPAYTVDQQGRLTAAANVMITATDLGLGSVEDTALSTWAGSTNLTTLGTITTGTWNGTALSLSGSYITGVLTESRGGTGVALIPSASYYSTGTTVLATLAFTKVLFAGSNFDHGSYMSSSRYTPLIAGTYHVSWAIRITDPQLLTLYTSALYKNGNNYKQGSSGQITVTASGYAIVGSALVNMNGTTDYIEIYGYNNHATLTATVQSSQTNCYFDITWVSP